MAKKQSQFWLVSTQAAGGTLRTAGKQSQHFRGSPARAQPAVPSALALRSAMLTPRTAWRLIERHAQAGNPNASLIVVSNSRKSGRISMRRKHGLLLAGVAVLTLTFSHSALAEYR